MLDELEIAKQLRAYGYSIKHGYPLAHQTITKLSAVYKDVTQEEVINEILIFHPILGFDTSTQPVNLPYGKGI